ncbi:MAG: 6-bladed beta-propeller, partial [bacterium]|nr:6-bladed beta-propeller [bacterium]
VQIIHNEYPLWEDYPEVSLEFVRKYGELDTEDENLMLFRPTDVVCDNNGNIFILDTGNNRIQKFDPEGNFLMTISRKGQGPDELNNPYSMNIFNDEIYVCDMGNQRIQIFSTDGHLIRSIKMGFEGGKRFTNFRLLSTGEYLTKPAPFMFPNEDIKTVSLVHILDNECTPVKGIGAGNLEDFGDFVINVFMALSGYERDSDDNVYLAYGFQNKIEKYSADGTLVFRADRPLEINVNTNPTNQMDVVLVSHSIAVDMKDRLWVSTAVKQKSLAEMSEEDFQKEFDEQHVVLEIFNSGGILLGKIPLPEMGNTPALPPIALPSMGNIRIYGDRFFLVDIASKMCVYEYRIVEN